LRQLERRPDSPVHAWRLALALAECADVAQALAQEVIFGLLVSGRPLLALAGLARLTACAPSAAQELARQIAAYHDRQRQRTTNAKGDSQRSCPQAEFDPVPHDARSPIGDPAAVRAWTLCLESVNRWYRVPDGDRTLAIHPLFGQLSGEDLALLALRGSASEFSARDRVISAGAPGTALCLVVGGIVQVVRDGVVLARLGSGAFFGEMALLSGASATADVIAESTSLVLVFPRDELERLARARPPLGNTLARYARERLVRNLVNTCELFVAIGEERRQELLDLFQSRIVDLGERLIDEGDPPPGLMMVLSGSVQVSRQEASGTIQLARLGPGGVVGEMSLLDRKPAMASVVATERSVLLVLPRDQFNRGIARFPEVLAHIWALAGERALANRRLEFEPALVADDDHLVT
jgi:CRP-like cAMP-binding protein